MAEVSLTSAGGLVPDCHACIWKSSWGRKCGEGTGYGSAKKDDRYIGVRWKCSWGTKCGEERCKAPVRPHHNSSLVARCVPTSEDASLGLNDMHRLNILHRLRGSLTSRAGPVQLHM